MRKRKILPAFIAAVMMILTLSACGKGGSVLPDEPYTGILTRVKIGMPVNQIRAMQRVGVALLNESDTVLWAIDDDIELMELRHLLPEQQEEQMFFFVDNSRAIITYYFKSASADRPDELVLKGFSEEVFCLLEREAGNAYFREKSGALRDRHSPGTEVRFSMRGVEGIDLTLVTAMSLSLPSYDLTFTMTETYDTVNDVTDYYVTHYVIEIMEKLVREAVPVN